MKVAFLDRDGVINRKAAEQHYIARKEDFIFNAGIFDLCHLLQEKGYALLVITNQRGIARELYTEQDLEAIHKHMLAEFKKRNISILHIFYCPHDYDECECRKPKDGMLKKATELYTIDLKDSVLISDTQDDVDMGRKFGIGKNILVPSDHPELFIEGEQKLQSRYL